MNRPYLVISPGGGRIVADFVFPHTSGGACFVSIGWAFGGGHPFHIIPGPIQQDSDSWLCGDNTVIRSVTCDDRDEWSCWLKWLEFKASPEGRHATDEVALAAMRQDGAITTGILKIDTVKIVERLFSNTIVRSRILRDYGIATLPSTPAEFQKTVVDALNQLPVRNPLEQILSNKDVFRAAVKALGSNNRAWSRFIKTEAGLCELLSDYDPNACHAAFESGDLTIDHLRQYLPGQSSTADAKAIRQWASLLAGQENYYGYIRTIGNGFRRETNLSDSALLLCIVGYLAAPPTAKVVKLDVRGLPPEFRKLPGMGYTLASEFMRNLGWSGFKPDRHVQRLFDIWLPYGMEQQSSKVKDLMSLQGRRDKSLERFFSYSLIGIAASPPDIPISAVDNLVWLVGAYLEKKGKVSEIVYVFSYR